MTTFLIIVLSLIGLVVGALLAIVGFALISPALKETLKHNPDAKNKLSLFIEVEEKRAAVIERAGTPISIIHGGDDLESIASWQEIIGKKRIIVNNVFLQLWWEKYKKYVYVVTGLYVYLPFFTTPKVIPLPRYETDGDANGNKIYRRITENDDGFRTNHVRLNPTIWPFRFGGVDIDGIPFTVNGSLVYYIAGDYGDEPISEERRKEANKAIYNSLYKTDSWNVLLDESANSVIRATVRDKASIDKILGKVNRKLWVDDKVLAEKAIDAVSDKDMAEEAKQIVDELFTHLSMQLLERLQDHVIGQTKRLQENDRPEAEDFSRLKDYGIKVIQVFITDFIPDLTDPELLSLRAPALGRQEARAIEARGSAHVNIQKKLLKVHEKGGEASRAILNAEALVRALQGVSGRPGPSTESALLAKLALKESSTTGGEK